MVEPLAKRRRVKLTVAVSFALLVVAGAILAATGFAGTSRDDALTVGLLHLYYGEDQAAVKQMAAALKAYPDDPELQAGMALALQESGDGVGAANAWKKLAAQSGAQTSPSNGQQNASSAAGSSRAAFLAMAGEALRQSGRLDEADRLFADALKQNAKLALALAGRGRVRSEREKWAEALPFFQQAVATNEAYNEARFELGRALHGLGRNAEAVTELKKAVLADSTYAEAYLELGRTYRDLGRSDEAEFALRRAVTLSPGLPGARAELDRLLTEKDK